MELALRYQSVAGTDRVISVDGAFGAPGLNLSHWPGNRTPIALRRDLSTEIVLAFGALPAKERERLAFGCSSIVNNHFDTDGNCSMFAARHPELARARATALLEAAAAGDFFRGSSERGFAIDCIVGAVVDPLRSPIASDLCGLSDLDRWQRASEFLFEHFPRLLDGELADFGSLYESELAHLRCDVNDLERAAKDDIAHLDLCVWSAPMNSASSRNATQKSFDPGRHALFKDGARDRVLAVGPRREGTTYRLVFSTLSWFDLVTRTTLPRAPLEQLAARLNDLEGLGADADIAWRYQATGTPSPELWFGRAQHEMFAEHCAALEPSRQAPAIVRRTITDALRDALSLPE